MAGASAAGAFVLDAPAIIGEYGYDLFQNGIADPGDGDWYMRAASLAPTVPVYENQPIVLLGLALDYDARAGAGRSHVYGIANLTYEFLEGTAADVADVNVAFEPDSFGAELGVGGTYRWADGKYALYGEALASSSFEAATASRAPSA